MDRKFLRFKPSEFTVIALLFALAFFSESAGADTIGPGEEGECTIGVFSPQVTSDGRPILWKNRDVSNRDQRFIYFESYRRDGLTTIPFIGNIYRWDTTSVYMGANEAGFAIMNSDSYNLGDSLGNAGMTDGTLMRIALETCITIADFEALLDSTNIVGRRDCWNFGVLDSSGDCAMFECSNRNYVKFSPADGGGQNDGFIIRANFSVSGGSSRAGEDRYLRALSLSTDRLVRGRIDVAFVLKDLARDLCNRFDDPYPLPYNGVQGNGPAGYIYNIGTISGTTTSSAVALRGVAAGEEPSLTTIFAILGSPLLSVAYPLWVESRSVPIFLSHPDGAPMYSYCLSRRARLFDDADFPLYLNSLVLTDYGGEGIFSYTLPLEQWAVNETDLLLRRWGSMPVGQVEIAFQQNRIADVIFNGFRLESAGSIPDGSPGQIVLPEKIAFYNYPNPFNGATTIVSLGADEGGPVTLRIFDTLGRLVKSINGTFDNSRSVTWRGDDSFGNAVGSGVYYYSVQTDHYSGSSKMVVLR